MSIDILNVKRKRIEKALFNASVSGENNYLNVNIIYTSKKNDYLHIHMTFLNELNDQSHSNLILNDFNILNIIIQTNQNENENLINLIINPNLNKSLSFIKFMNLDTRVVINSNCTRHFFIDRLIFITYIKI